MQVQYVSEKTHKTYASKEECEADEAKYDVAIKEQQEKVQKLKDERTSRAKEVEDAYKAMVDAQHHYEDLLNKFLHDYQSYHMTIFSNYHPKTIEELFNEMFRNF
jgi:Mg2+ and Co2+ transporter CorA